MAPRITCSQLNGDAIDIAVNAIATVRTVPLTRPDQAQAVSGGYAGHVSAHPDDPTLSKVQEDLTEGRLIYGDIRQFLAWGLEEWARTRPSFNAGTEMVMSSGQGRP